MKRFDNMIAKRKTIVEKSNAKKNQMREKVEKMLDAKGMTLNDII